MKIYGKHRNYKIFLASSKADRHFYCQMGRFFSSKEVIKELEGPICDSEGHYWLLVKSGIEIVGFASCRDAGNGLWWYCDAWIHPEHRRNGLYRKLFTLREAFCVEQGALVLKGTALPHSRALFEESGYTVTSQRGPRWTWFEKRLEEK